MNLLVGWICYPDIEVFESLVDSVVRFLHCCYGIVRIDDLSAHDEIS